MCALPITPSGGFALSKVTFHANGTLGTMICDSGTSRTSVTGSFVKRSGLTVRPFPSSAALAPVKLPNGEYVSPAGLVDIPVTVQLMLEVDDESLTDPTFMSAASGSPAAAPGTASSDPTPVFILTGTVPLRSAMSSSCLTGRTRPAIYMLPGLNGVHVARAS